jgi:hypothetical protein
MAGAPTPQTLLEAIASDATSGFITNPIPDAPTGTNAASVQQGFPPITMTEELAGGEPPLGQDMNGFMFLISSHTLYVECGQPYLYNAALATAIGGYLAGTILGMADGTGLWLNLSSGNTSNPDVTAGVNWAPLAAYGNSSVTGLTGGTANLPSGTTKYKVIILSGALTSNLTVNLPATNQDWLIVNNTTGAFSTRVQTALNLASVLVPQGGFGSPTQVYGVGDGNIYPRVAPLSVPIDQAPTPSTLAERTNTGAVLATVFNSNESVTNPTIANVIVDDGTGNLLKISLANFRAQVQPGAQIVKAAQVALNNGANRVNFASAFPNSVTSIVLTPVGAGATYFITSQDVNGFNIDVGVTQTYNYIAAGT